MILTNRYKYCDHCGAKIVLGEKCEKCYNERLSMKREKKRNYSRQYYNENKDTQKTIKSERWKKFRRMIIQRDNGVCQRCLAKRNILVGDNLEVHHIKPRTKYPTLVFEESNVITICKTCNLELGTREELDFEPPFNTDTENTFHL